jgi:hypothetical protein
LSALYICRQTNLNSHSSSCDLSALYICRQTNLNSHMRCQDARTSPRYRLLHDFDQGYSYLCDQKVLNF